MDIVFIHGLLGGVFYTWRQRNRDSAVVGIMGKSDKKGMSILGTLTQ